MKKTQTVYVVGIRTPLGCELTRGVFYETREEAEREVTRDREQGIDFTAVFALERTEWKEV